MQAIASLSSGCIESVKIRLDVIWYLYRLLQVLEWKLNFWKSTCIRQNCYHQAGASDGNASWYRLDDCKATSLQQTCCNLCVSDSVFLYVHDIVVCTWTLTKSMFSFPKHKRKRHVELNLLRKYDIIYQKAGPKTERNISPRHSLGKTDKHDSVLVRDIAKFRREFPLNLSLFQ